LKVFFQGFESPIFDTSPFPLELVILPCTVIVGGFFGDEGKGKVVSYLALNDDIDAVVRGGVGPNAGHTVVWREKEYKFRMIPSAFMNPDLRLLIGPGVLVNPKILLQEIELTSSGNRVGVDYNCAIIEDKHIQIDKGSDYLKGKIGTTGTGCGPCNADRVNRTVKVAREIEMLTPYLTDVSLETNRLIDDGRGVLIEGTQGTFLSLFHGTYPFCTSKDVTASAMCSDVGVGPTKILDVLVVFKAYTTRVGGGPLEGELSPEETDRRGWSEFGAVTGRRRRASEFNYDLAKRAIMLNGGTMAAVTKLDILFPESRECQTFDVLPDAAKSFVRKIEVETGVPVTIIGTGPGTDDVIDRRE
jgi:adenylosuccinate synthase